MAEIPVITHPVESTSVYHHVTVWVADPIRTQSELDHMEVGCFGWCLDTAEEAEMAAAYCATWSGFRSVDRSTSITYHGPNLVAAHPEGR